MTNLVTGMRGLLDILMTTKVYYLRETIRKSNNEEKTVRLVIGLNGGNNSKYITL